MRRKIIQQNSSYTLTLPINWIKELNLKSGSEVEVDEIDKRLIVGAERGDKIERSKLDFSNRSLMIKRIIASRYLKGADEIEVKFDTLEKSRILQKRVDEMIGMEVVEQEKDRMLVKDMSSNKDDSFDSIIRRVFFLLHTISDESLKALDKNETNLQFLEDMELNVNKFTDYCFRILNKKGYEDSRKTSTFYTILYLLEEIGDEYKNVLKYIRKNKLKLSKDLLKTFKKISVYQNDLEKELLDFTFEKATQLALDRDRIIKELDKQIEKSKSVKEVVVISHFKALTEDVVKISGQLLNLN